MALKRQSVPRRAYGIDNSLQDLAPLSIVSTRAPGASDIAEIGTQWVDKTNDAVYVLTSVAAGVANWATAPSSGATTLASLEVTNASDLQGNVDVGGTLDVVGLTTVDDLTATGTTTISGDLDLSSAALIDLTSTLNADPSIYLHANGGTDEVIRLRSDQGTGADSIDLVSDVGGISLTATGFASADAINLSANAGGVDIDGALQVNIASSQNAASAIVVSASAGGIDISAAGAAGEDIDIVNTAGSVNISGGEAIATAVVISAGAGGIDISNTGSAGLDIDIVSTGASVNMRSTENAANAIFIEADGGTSETVYIHSDQGTGAASIHLESDVGGVTLTSGLASTDAINLSAASGGVDIDGALEVNITSSEASVADAVTISASHSAGGITLDAGATPGVTLTNGTQSAQWLVGTGSPNGSVTASQGSMYIDVAGSSSTTILFVNSDGGTTWVGVGA